jgi:cytochrome c oxidase subunit 1
VNVAISLRGGRVVGPNPWQAASLEWKPSSPPPSYNFDHIPVVESRTPLWDSDQAVMPGLRADKREVLLTTVIDAMPDLRDASPAPTPWPLITAILLTIGFIGSIFTPWAVVWGAAILAPPLILWFWPHDPLDTKPEQADE